MGMEMILIPNDDDYYADLMVHMIQWSLRFIHIRMIPDDGEVG